MSRWLVDGGNGVASVQALVAIFSMIMFFSVCVTMLLALCAAHGSPQVLNRESEPEVESPDCKKESQGFSNNLQVKLSSFRRDNLQIKLGSFRLSSFRRIDCRQVDVVDALQSHQVVEEDGAAVWQRAILRGERCAPLVFSGLILYDEKGNPLPLRKKSDDYRNDQQHRTTDSI